MSLSSFSRALFLALAFPRIIAYGRKRASAKSKRSPSSFASGSTSAASSRPRSPVKDAIPTDARDFESSHAIFGAEEGMEEPANVEAVMPPTEDAKHGSAFDLTFLRWSVSRTLSVAPSPYHSMTVLLARLIAPRVCLLPLPPLDGCRRVPDRPRRLLLSRVAHDASRGHPPSRERDRPCGQGMHDGDGLALKEGRRSFCHRIGRGTSHRPSCPDASLLLCPALILTPHHCLLFADVRDDLDSVHLWIGVCVSVRNWETERCLLLERGESPPSALLLPSHPG